MFRAGINVESRFQRSVLSPWDYPSRCPRLWLIDAFGIFAEGDKALVMIIYSVTISLEATIESEWIGWMKKVHVPDVLKTGCFSECQIHKAVGPGTDEPTYVLQYSCQTIDDYQRYRDNFARALQKDHTNRFSGRFRGSRLVMEEVARFAPRQ
jgi:uncharacterized protein DUF4286